jgi:hypothetical protein
VTPLVQARLRIGVTAHDASEQVFVVGAGPLPGGGVLILVRRIDLPGYPVVALRVH